MSGPLDLRARAASAGVHESVSGLAADIDRRPTHAPYGPRLALVAAAIVAVVAMAFSSRADSPREASLAAGGGGRPVPEDARAALTAEEMGSAGWTVYADASGAVEIVEDTSAGMVESGCGGTASGDVEVHSARTQAGQVIVYGVIRVGAADMLRLSGDGRPLDARFVGMADEASLFVVVATDATVPSELVVSGADGVELSRAPVPDVVDPTAADAGRCSVGFGGSGTPITPAPGG